MTYMQNYADTYSEKFPKRLKNRFTYGVKDGSYVYLYNLSRAEAERIVFLMQQQGHPMRLCAVRMQKLPPRDPYAHRIFGKDGSAYVPHDEIST